MCLGQYVVFVEEHILTFKKIQYYEHNQIYKVFLNMSLKAPANITRFLNLRIFPLQNHLQIKLPHMIVCYQYRYHEHCLILLSNNTCKIDRNLHEFHQNVSTFNMLESMKNMGNVLE